MKTAKDINGHTIRVGDAVQLHIYGALLDGGGREPDSIGPVVIVQALHKQGYDGTIVTTDPAPDPEYPDHHSGRASRFTLKRTA